MVKRITNRLKGGRERFKKIKSGRIFVYALALAAIGGSGYLVYNKIRRKSNSGQEDYQEENTDTRNKDIPTVTTSSTKLITAGGNFPLKRGTKGALVSMLQKALARNNPSLKIDGQFGPATVNALKAAGYPEKIDEATFTKITGANSTTVKVVFNPMDIGLRLYRSAQSKNSGQVLSILQEIRSVQDYSLVNEYYKKQGLFISRTIVTDLLDYVFKNDESAKEQIKREFLRIGLKQTDSGIWSLQGIRLNNDLITIRDTVVIDGSNIRIPVKRNTILGDEVNVANGMTWFRSVDNTILKVPTRDVKYS